jgi:hypothetical protein
VLEPLKVASTHRCLIACCRPRVAVPAFANARSGQGPSAFEARIIGRLVFADQIVFAFATTQK